MFCAIMHFSMSLKCYESIKLTYSDYLTRGVGFVNVENVLLSIYFWGNLSPILTVTIRFVRAGNKNGARSSNPAWGRKNNPVLNISRIMRLQQSDLN